MLYRSASLAMSTSVLKALPGKLDIKSHSPSILYLLLSPLFVGGDVLGSLFCNAVHSALPNFAINLLSNFNYLVTLIIFVFLLSLAISLLYLFLKVP